MLPKLNDTMQYTMVIPSQMKEVKFRPYLVKEEKTMMLALESNDARLVLDTIASTVESCLIDYEGSVRKLTTFDIEYMFLQIRSKSVGESVELNVSCQECQHTQQHTLEFDKIKPPVINKKLKTLIEITDTIKIQMKYPSYVDLMNSTSGEVSGSENEKALSTIFSAIISCIDYIMVNDEEKISAEDYTYDQLVEFIEQFTSAQFNKLKEFIVSVPNLEHAVKWKCGSCGHNNEVVMRGTTDFFQ